MKCSALSNANESILYSQVSFTRAYFFEKNIQIQDSLFFQGSQSCKKAVMRHSDFAPIYNMVVVKLSTWPDFLDDDLKVDTQLAIHAIAAELGKHID